MGECGFFLSVKFATSLLASVAGGSVIHYLPRCTYHLLYLQRNAQGPPQLLVGKHNCEIFDTFCKVQIKVVFTTNLDYASM